MRIKRTFTIPASRSAPSVLPGCLQRRQSWAGWEHRLRFIVNFPVPGPPDRKRIWQRIFPPETPTTVLDFDRLARFNLTGGGIHNAALNAAFLACAARTPVTMLLVLNAIRTEFLKSDRLISEADFHWEGPE